MKTLDLRQALPDAMAQLQVGGERSSVTAVLKTLGVAMAPTLGRRREAAQAPTLRAPGATPTVGDLDSLGRFQLRGELGRGGMGRVLEARDPELRRSVAVKVIINPGQVTEEQLARFVAEAQVTSQLEHPNIVPVHEIGVTEGGDLFFVME